MPAKTERNLSIRTLAADLADISGFSTPAYRTQFEERARAMISSRLDDMDGLVSELTEQRDRYRAALEVIAGSEDRLQAMQAACALENIGPAIDTP